MAHDAKLEIYQIKIQHRGNEYKTFKDFFIDSLESINSNEENDDSFVFLEYFRKFIADTDTENFISYSRKQKAFTAYDTRPQNTADNPSIIIHTERFIIEGTIEGGRYGQKRNKSSLNNKSQKEVVNNSDIILDRFYFSLYTPLDSDLGVLFIQSYTSDSISDIFIDFISKFFGKRINYKKAKIEKYVPESIKNEFRENSEIKKFYFSNRFLFEHQSNNPIREEREEFNIKIEAVSKNGIRTNKLDIWLYEIGNKLFNNRSLLNFTKGKVYIKNTETKKETPFKINTNFDIKPIILLENRVELDEFGLPNINQLRDYCFELLDSEIIDDLYFDE